MANQSNASTTLPEEVNRQEHWKNHAMNWSNDLTLPREDSKLCQIEQDMGTDMSAPMTTDNGIGGMVLNMTTTLA